MFEDFCIKLAELTVSLRAEGAYTRDLCLNFLTASGSVPDIAVTADEKSLLAEMESVSSPYCEDDRRDICESICLYRAIAEKLPLFDRFVMHGAAVEVGGRAYLFTAPSGTGKTTHIKLWKRVFGEKVTVINGDKPILGLKDGNFFAFSTPWAGKEDLKTNISAPLGGICILTRGEINHIEKVAPGDYFSALMNQVYYPKDSAARLSTLDLLDKLSRAVPFYLLSCNISEEAAKLSFETMTKE